MSDEYRDAVHEYAAAVFRMEAAAIEEAAERILLSGTNHGIRVWRWFEGNRAIVVAEPTPDIPDIQYLDGPPPDPD